MSKETLSDITKRLRRALADGHAGPLRIAKEVLGVVQRWPTYKDEANMSPNEWLRTIEAGANMSYFKVRAKAADRLGSEVVRWDHIAAVWAHRQAVNDKAFKDLVVEVRRQRMERGTGTPPLSKDAVVRVSRLVWGTTPRQPKPPAECEECVRRQSKIEELERRIGAH